MRAALSQFRVAVYNKHALDVSNIGCRQRWLLDLLPHDVADVGVLAVACGLLAVECGGIGPVVDRSQFDSQTASYVLFRAAL